MKTISLQKEIKNQCSEKSSILAASSININTLAITQSK